MASANFLSAFPALLCLAQQKTHIPTQTAIAATTVLKMPILALWERSLKRWVTLFGGGAFRIFKAVEFPGTV